MRTTSTTKLTRLLGNTGVLCTALAGLRPLTQLFAIYGKCRVLGPRVPGMEISV